jgi:hypothetical protein
LFSLFQYITLSLAYSISKPYRASALTNYYFIVNVIILFALGIYINIEPPKFLKVPFFVRFLLLSLF